MRRQNFVTGETMFAGDSGDDPAVRASGIPSILAANASREVAMQAQNLARNRENLPTLYPAKRGFLDMNSNYSAGILESIAYYFPFGRIGMEQEDA